MSLAANGWQNVAVACCCGEHFFCLCRPSLLRCSDNLEDVETNFPPLFLCFFTGQTKEIARQCVEPPLRSKGKQQPPFKPRPSLQPVVSFLVSAVKQLPHEKCQLCKQLCLPQDPQTNKVPPPLKLSQIKKGGPTLCSWYQAWFEHLARLHGGANLIHPWFHDLAGRERIMSYPIRSGSLASIGWCPEQPRVVYGVLKELQDGEAEKDESADRHVERVYCSHLFHLECLITFMKTPPFHGGKKCPTCGQRIYHDKWRLSEKITEDRWAHQQARERELKEVAEFLE
uniref:Uncharacterized protein n=1 Tax=Timema monikensis TaxID=170555 RepID=A0A7R9EDX7_9NEOP|nr:unnamed protein product [Timema monikensis]